jgi:hypothetical protein
MRTATRKRISPREILSDRWWRASGVLVIMTVAVLVVGALRRDDSNKAASVIGSMVPPSSPSNYAAPKPSGPRRLLKAESSPEELARRFLKAMHAGDEDAIRALRLTREEFCSYVWPELESSRIPNVSCDFGWRQATLRSEGGLYDLLPSRKGKQYELISIRFAKGADAYPTYKVHKEPWLLVRDGDGAQKEVRFFGSMLEMDGQYKLFSFVND